MHVNTITSMLHYKIVAVSINEIKRTNVRHLNELTLNVVYLKCPVMNVKIDQLVGTEKLFETRIVQIDKQLFKRLMARSLMAKTQEEMLTYSKGVYTRELITNVGIKSINTMSAFDVRLAAMTCFNVSEVLKNDYKWMSTIIGNTGFEFIDNILTQNRDTVV
jgi:hypothetical protein